MPVPSDTHSGNRPNGQPPRQSGLTRAVTFFVIFFLTLGLIIAYSSADILATSPDLSRAFVVTCGLFIMAVYFFAP